MMDKKTFTQCMTLIKEAFPKMEFSVPVYWEMLKDLEPKALRIGVSAVVKGMPEIYPGTNLIGIIRHHALTSPYPSIGEAWKNAFDVAQKGYESVKWIHPFVKKAADQIGIYEIKTTENPAITRSHFFKVYEDLVKNEKENRIFKIAAIERRQLEDGTDKTRRDTSSH